jgi:periplasmic divalent cation tolerance protein
MKSAARFAIVIVTAPNLKTGRALAKAALESRLIACANLLPNVQSHYWWQGKLESSPEVLLVMKTTRRRLPELEQLILAKHPYDTAEFLVLPVRSGSARYLDWLAATVQESG